MTATITAPVEFDDKWYICEGSTGNGSTYTAIYHTTDRPKIKNLFRGTIDLMSIYGKKSGKEFCRYVDGWIQYPLGDVEIIMKAIYE